MSATARRRSGGRRPPAGCAVVARRADVAGHRRLAVGARDHAAHGAERLGAEAAVDPGLRDASRPPRARLRRHREAHVLAEQPLEAGAGPAFRCTRRSVRAVRARPPSRRCPAATRAPLGQVLPHRGSRALERAVHGRRAGLEHLRGLPCRAAEDIAQDQHRALQRGEALDRDEVGELDRLLGDDGGLGVVSASAAPRAARRDRAEPERPRRSRNTARGRLSSASRQALVAIL